MPGQSDITTIAAPCRYKGSGVHMVAMNHCAHDFIEVADYTKDERQVRRLRRRDVPDPLVPGAWEFTLTDYDLLPRHCGFRLDYCVRCGAMRKVLPSWAEDKLISR